MGDAFEEMSRIHESRRQALGEQRQWADDRHERGGKRSSGRARLAEVIYMRHQY